MFQCLAVACCFLTSFVMLFSSPPSGAISEDAAFELGTRALAESLIADTADAEAENAPTEPPELPAPDPFEGMEMSPPPGGWHARNGTHQFTRHRDHAGRGAAAPDLDQRTTGNRQR